MQNKMMTSCITSHFCGEWESGLKSEGKDVFAEWRGLSYVLVTCFHLASSHNNSILRFSQIMWWDFILCGS